MKEIIKILHLSLVIYFYVPIKLYIFIRFYSAQNHHDIMSIQISFVRFVENKFTSHTSFYFWPVQCYDARLHFHVYVTFEFSRLGHNFRLLSRTARAWSKTSENERFYIADALLRGGALAQKSLFPCVRVKFYCKLNAP